MNILIVSATKEEVLPLLETHPFHYNKSDNLYSVTSGKKIDVLITGVGMVAMAFATGKYLNNNYDVVLNAGIAGSFTKKFKIGDVVEVTEDIISEMGAEDGEEFLTLDEMGLEESWKSKFGSRDLENKVLNSLLKVKAISVNTVHGNEISIKNITARFNPGIETMEGAAFMFACEKINIPYAQIRAISNYVEKRDRSKWNIPLAIANLNNTLTQIIESL
jgi:futalosine hydrolase